MVGILVYQTWLEAATYKTVHPMQAPYLEDGCANDYGIPGYKFSHLGISSEIAHGRPFLMMHHVGVGFSSARLVASLGTRHGLGLQILLCFLLHV